MMFFFSVFVARHHESLDLNMQQFQIVGLQMVLQLRLALTLPTGEGHKD